MRIFLFFILILTSCTSQKKQFSRQDVLKLSLSEEPTTLDPRLCRTLNGSNLCRMLFEGLTSYDKEGNLVYALADSIEQSTDRKLYKFHLRKAFWSNGKQIVAEDFIRSWKSSLDPKFPAPNSDMLFLIKGARQLKLGEKCFDMFGARAVDEQTLEVELEALSPYFLQLCSLPIYFPIPKDANFRFDEIVFNGPYVADQWMRQEKILLKKNVNYWHSDETVLNYIELHFLSPETALQLFNANELDWVGSPISYLPPESLEKLSKTGGYKKAPLCGTSFLRLNISCKKLSSSVVRKRIASSINRDEIAYVLLQNSQIPATCFVPPAMGLENQNLIPEIETGSVEPTSFKLLYQEDPRARVIAQAIQGQIMKTLPFEVVLESAESRHYFEKLKKGDYEIALSSWIADFNDPINFLDLFKNRTSNANMTGWESKEYLEQLELSALCVGKERIERLARAERILMEEMPIVPIFHYQMNYMSKNEVQDVALFPTGLMDCRWAKIQGVNR